MQAGTRWGGRCRASSPRAVCGALREKKVGEGLPPLFFLKRMTATKSPPRPPLPLHPTSAPRLRAAHPFSSSAPCGAGRLLLALTRRSRLGGDCCGRGGPGHLGGGGGCSAGTRTQGGRAVRGGRGRARGWGPGLLLHSPPERLVSCSTSCSFKKRRKKEPSSERPPAASARPPASPVKGAAAARGSARRAADTGLGGGHPRASLGSGRWVARASRAAAARWVCEGPPRACGTGCWVDAPIARAGQVASRVDPF